MLPWLFKAILNCLRVWLLFLVHFLLGLVRFITFLCNIPCVEWLLQQVVNIIWHASNIFQLLFTLHPFKYFFTLLAPLDSVGDEAPPFH